MLSLRKFNIPSLPDRFITKTILPQISSLITENRFLVSVATTVGLMTCIYFYRQLKAYELAAKYNFLAAATLKSLTDQKRIQFKAAKLWHKNGAVIFALRKPWCTKRLEAAKKVSELKTALDARNIPVCIVTSETFLMAGMKRNFTGDIYVDMENRFFLPNQDRPSSKKPDKLLDGIYIMKPNSQGILMEHRKKEIDGDIDVAHIINVVKQIQTQS